MSERGIMADSHELKDNLIKGQKDRITRLESQVKELEAELGKVKEERDDATEWNYSVAVCKDHTSQIVVIDEADFCAICEINKLESSNARLRECLRKLEWFQSDESKEQPYDICPVCTGERRHGHGTPAVPDCWLAKELEG